MGLLKPRSTELDPAQLDRLDFFVAELAKNGVYANLNLHVARRYDGLEGPAAKRFEFGKMLDWFYPPFIESQKVYARALLAHVNPYTQHAYTAEPAVLCVEMNNENTALPFWAGNLDDLPEPYATEIKSSGTPGCAGGTAPPRACAPPGAATRRSRPSSCWPTPISRRAPTAGRSSRRACPRAAR